MTNKLTKIYTYMYFKHIYIPEAVHRLIKRFYP